MDVSQFLAECLLLDLETRGDKIDRIGAVRGDAVFERKGRFDLRRALRELDVFSAGVPYLLGHNLLDHDVPTLHRVGGQLQLLKKPIVDTLFLSPLAFPENPYHRLVSIVGDRVCRAALADVLGECFRHVQERTALAYAVAWLERAGFLERNHNETRVFQGKVQVLQVDDGHHQAMAFVSELQRLRQLKPDLRWNDCAVLARTRKDLDPIRGLCEHYGIPVRVNLSRDKAPSLSRIREIANFINDIKLDSTAEDSSLGAGGLARASQLRDRLAAFFFGKADNPWASLLRNLLQAWEEETADGELPVSHVVEYIYETLSELRRDQWIGDGVFLGTVHGAKGMEFSHVFIPDGGWSVPGAKSKGQEEERRVFYVAMTRAKETLCLIRQEKSKNPHLKLLQGDFMLQRPGSFLPDAPRTAMEHSYELLGMQDLFLDYAGRRPRTDFIHKSLAALKPGSRLKARRRGDRVELLDEQERTVAVLSRTASRDWIPRIPRIKAVRVVAMVQRESRDSGEEFQQHCRCARWEIPWVEMLVDAAGSTSSSKAPTDPSVCP